MNNRNIEQHIETKVLDPDFGRQLGVGAGSNEIEENEYKLLEALVSSVIK